MARLRGIYQISFACREIARLQSSVMHFEVHRGEFTISTDPARIDFAVVFGFLSQTYWAKNRPKAAFEKALRNSFCFGVYHGVDQVGFARAITDYATFAYLADVFILEPFRGRGLGLWLVNTMLMHPELKAMRRWALVTQDAHGLYARCGFVPASHPEHIMERLQPYGS